MLEQLTELQAFLDERGLDGWLLYDFKGQNPTAVAALGLAGHMLTRRWFLLVPRKGAPTLLVHAPAYGLVREEHLAAYDGRVETLAVPGGHIVMWDAFDEVADAVERFLS